MSPNEQLILPDFPPPKKFVARLQHLHVGARYTIVFYDQDILVGSNEVSQIEDMLFAGFEVHGSEIQLLLSEDNSATKRL